MMRNFLACFLVLTLACACRPSPAPAQVVTLTPIPTLPPQATPPESPAMNEVPVPTPLDPYLAALADQARADLAQRLGVDAAAIELVEASAVTWPDSSLGCPKPGMLYTQVLVDGLRLRFRAGGRIYNYHGGGSQAPFLCEE